ncbi:hypothetical protein [Miltoncostaea oceani]|uniref:hypothetical protein n=1 Tax=Miltoncostaea oceani TaxID=2843216 RepID=UPI001C3CF3C5|nr:hypothetical protein [Miltoncostaea oceani]
MRMRPRGGHAVGSGLQVAVGLGLWNLGNYAFFLIAGRVLGPADYGLVAAILSGVLVIQTPFTSLQTALARVVSSTPPARGAALYRAALRTALRWTPAGAAVAALAVIAAGAVRDDVPVGPLLAAIVVLLPVAVFPLVLGQLQGERRFGRYALTMAAFGLPRPVMLLALVGGGLGIYAALLGTAATTILAAVVGVLFTADRLRATAAGPPDPALVRAMGASLLPLLVGVTAVAVMSNLDVIAAKLALDPVDAGLFASAAVLAKTVFLVPQAITIVLLPRVAHRHATGLPTEALLAVSLGATLVLGGLCTLAALVLADPIMTITFGEEFADGASILPELTGAMTLIGAALTLLYHQVALGSYRVAWLLAGAAGALAVGLALVHDTAGHIIAVDAVVATAALLAHDPVCGRSGDTIVGGTRALLRTRAA